MAADRERMERVRRVLRGAQLDAVVCALPARVLMISGYWPVVGASVVVFTSDGRALVLAPEDELHLAQRGWAEVRTYTPASLDSVTSVAEALRGPLASLARELGLKRARIGVERGPASEPASYVGMHLFGSSLERLLRTLMPGAAITGADEVLERLAAIKTADEVECIRLACRIAEQAFLNAAPALAPGLRETEVAAQFRAPLSVLGNGEADPNTPAAARWKLVARADGFVFCMSGANSAQAYAAYARSRARRLERGDLVLVHCNSYADGWWTDITRTYSLGMPGQAANRMYEAVFSARDAALKSIRPGVRCAAVDQAARQEIAARGLANAFKHSTGHGVGFAAISANARPRLHPQSEEVLEPGMVFNVEPAVYFEGFGGVRHCDVVTVTGSGVEVLTPFHDTIADLVLPATGEALSDAA